MQLVFKLVAQNMLADEFPELSLVDEFVALRQCGIVLVIDIFRFHLISIT